MVTRVSGGIITDQMLAGSLRYFEIDGGVADTEFAFTIADGIAGGNSQSRSRHIGIGGADRGLIGGFVGNDGSGSRWALRPLWSFWPLRSRFTLRPLRSN